MYRRYVPEIVDPSDLGVRTRAVRFSGTRKSPKIRAMDDNGMQVELFDTQPKAGVWSSTVVAGYGHRMAIVWSRSQAWHGA